MAPRIPGQNHTMAPPGTDPSPPATADVPAWAHRNGLLSLGLPCAPTDARAIADRLLCCECIARYCWGYDERRPDALAACFTENAVWEGNVLGRIPIGPFEGRERIMKWLTNFWPYQHDQRRHMLMNTVVEEQAQDTAVTLSYLQLLGSNGKMVALETTGFYRVRYHRTGPGWQIAHLYAGFDAPFWPGDLETMSARGRARHGIVEHPKSQAPDTPGSAPRS